MRRLQFAKHIFLLLLFLIGVFLLTPSLVHADDSWYNTSWLYRRKLVFNNSAQSENLTNFPVRVRLMSHRFDFTLAQSSGQDIRFTDSDGKTLLPYEIESYDASTKTADIWVKVPQIDASSSSDYIYMYYGNGSATDAQSPTSVWDGDFIMVQHLLETSGVATNDSTSNNIDGIKVSATSPNPDSSGQISGAQSFNGSSDYVRAPFVSTFDTITSAITMSVWLKPSTGSLSSRRDFLQRAGSIGSINGGTIAKDIWWFNLQNSGKINFYALNITGGAYKSSTNAISEGVWSHAVVTYDGSSIKFYINGVLDNTYSATGNFYTGSNQGVGIGANLSNSFAQGYFLGSMDEVRVSKIARSASWVAAAYKSELDTFITFATDPVSTSTDTAVHDDGPQIPQNVDGGGSGVFTAIQSDSKSEQQVTSIIEPYTFNFAGFFSAATVEPSEIATNIHPVIKNSGNTTVIGDSIMRLSVNKQNYWEVGNIHELWYRDFYNKAKILPSLQLKPSIVALSYSDNSLIIAGNPKKKFTEKSLKLAHSDDGVHWKILKTSVVDPVNNTVAALDRVAGYYMIVAK
jgi:hypothetical protein